MKKNELEFTGERFVTSLYNDNTLEHLHRYALACELVKDKVVLDLACGEGYGSNLMSEYATTVIGIDISETTVNHAASKYIKNNLKFICASATCTTLDDHFADVLVSFETIEHLVEQEEMMKEIVRVLKPTGILIMSSPDKKYYSDLTGHRNSFHLKELYFNEFKVLLKKHFSKQEFLLQRIAYGSVINHESNLAGLEFYSGNFEKIKKSKCLTSPVYNIAVCSNGEIPKVCNSLFDDMSIILASYENMSNALNSVINSRTYKLGKLMLAPKRFLAKLFK
jgi:ubiquinone/menaquinone biosynthesis C-methylase UbiE